MSGEAVEGKVRSACEHALGYIVSPAHMSIADVRCKPLSSLCPAGYDKPDFSPLLQLRESSYLEDGPSSGDATEETTPWTVAPSAAERAECVALSSCCVIVTQLPAPVTIPVLKPCFSY